MFNAILAFISIHQQIWFNSDKTWELDIITILTGKKPPKTLRILVFNAGIAVEINISSKLGIFYENENKDIRCAATGKATQEQMPYWCISGRLLRKKKAYKILKVWDDWTSTQSYFSLDAVETTIMRSTIDQ